MLEFFGIGGLILLSLTVFSVLVGMCFYSTSCDILGQYGLWKDIFSITGMICLVVKVLTLVMLAYSVHYLQQRRKYFDDDIVKKAIADDPLLSKM